MMRVILTSFASEQPCDNTVSDIVELDLKGDFRETRQVFFDNDNIRDVFESFFKAVPGECTVIKIERVDDGK